MIEIHAPWLKTDILATHAPGETSHTNRARQLTLLSQVRMKTHEASCETYEERISELKLEADERESLRYSEPFRAKAVELVGHLKAGGWTQRRISQELEIS